MMKILPFPITPELRAQAAELLVAEFAEFWPDAWPTIADAIDEVERVHIPDNIVLAALADDGTLLGWAGALPMYDGNVWEVHPLVVRGNAQGNGVGRALMLALEERVGQRGGLTIWVGTDDEAGLTTLGGVDLYPDVIEKVARAESVRRHPMTFYRKLGYEVVGVVPDANGFGKPDILMAKRVRS